jgi:exonuclease SbcC
MLLQSLRLKNIRSYADENIAFPEGIVLLAGDIGAGKSTILLAIEFALFGLLRGDLSGAALLRHGAKEGSVELTFSLHNKSLTVGRTLKRTKTSVEQDAGFVVENGLRRELTAIELKAFVLNLLGYPADLITKSKSLIYRYTVYTPQEDMKKIIMEDKESRLAILRKVFDIDKYRRIADNAAAYAKLLRERRRLLEGQLADEPLKKQQFQDKRSQAAELHRELLDIQPRLAAVRSAVAEQKTALEKLEASRAEIAQHRAVLGTADSQIKTLQQQKQSAEHELAQLAALLAEQPPAPEQSPQEIALQIRQRQEKLQSTDLELRKHVAARADLTATRRISEETKRKILALSRCPTCQQEVKETHKHSIVLREETAQNELLAHLARCEAALKTHEHVKQTVQQELLALQNRHTAAQTAQLKRQHYEQNLQRKQQTESRLSEAAEAIAAAELRKQEASAHVQASVALETLHLAEKNKLDLLRQQEQQAVVRHATLIERSQTLKEMLSLLEKELAAKQQARAALEKLNALHQWTGDFFAGLMSAMEKHVMTKVYHEFNALFRQWFGALIEDDVLVARLDEEFSPLVQQNGYDTAVENLSGGEKTACALAYRLALNKVIAALHSGIHTKDVLILDEPTDGFSEQQIDRMRDVLEQLKARQIVLVSHEPKIESLAHHVLRVVKEEHASKIIV